MFHDYCNIMDCMYKGWIGRRDMGWVVEAGARDKGWMVGRVGSWRWVVPPNRTVWNIYESKKC